MSHFGTLGITLYAILALPGVGLASDVIPPRRR